MAVGFNAGSWIVAGLDLQPVNFKRLMNRRPRFYSRKYGMTNSQWSDDGMVEEKQYQNQGEMSVKTAEYEFWEHLSITELSLIMKAEMSRVYAVLLCSR